MIKTYLSFLSAFNPIFNLACVYEIDFSHVMCKCTDYKNQRRKERILWFSKTKGCSGWNELLQNDFFSAKTFPHKKCSILLDISKFFLLSFILCTLRQNFSFTSCKKWNITSLPHTSADLQKRILGCMIMAALIYFDEMQNVNVKYGLSFFAWCLLANTCIFTLWNVRMRKQANKHCSKKVSPGFTFTFCVSSK